MVVPRAPIVTTRLRLDDIRRAWEARDPDLVRARRRPRRAGRRARGPRPRGGADVRPLPRRDPQPGLPPASRPRSRRTTASSRSRRSKPPTAEVPLPDRLRLHEVLDALWRRPGAVRPVVPAGDHRPGPAGLRPVAGPEADLQGGRGPRRHRGLRRPGRPVRRGRLGPSHAGRPPHARLPPPPRLAIPAADAPRPGPPATPTRRRRARPLRGRDATGTRPGSPTTSSTTRRRVRPGRLPLHASGRRAC